MDRTKKTWRALRGRLLGGLAVSFLFPLAGSVLAEGVLPECATPAVAPQVQNLSLEECLRIALERQPALDAFRASRAAAETNRRAVYHLCVPDFIARELPMRRQQATLGVTAASASVDQAEDETVYSVTRLYYSVLYAREQQKVAAGVVEHLKATLDTASRLVKEGHRDVTVSTVDKITVYLRLAEVKEVEAVRGIALAEDALREAVGAGPDFCFQVPAGGLSAPDVKVDRAQMICLALDRRPEIAAAQAVAEVMNLEIQAQGTKHLAVIADTFARVSDIHARQIPQGSLRKEYRPAAVGFDMPVTLVGCRCERMARARDFYARGLAVVDKARNLIALEAAVAHGDWEEAARKVTLTREAAAKAAKLAEDTRKAFGADQKVKAEEILANEVVAAQALAQNNEARHQLILALAALERVTAGGFQAGLAAHAP